MVEPFQSTARTACVLIGVLSLPLFEVERRFGEIIERVLGFGFSRNEVVLLVIILGFRGFGCLLSFGWSRLRFLLLLCRGDVLQDLLGVFGRAKDGFELGLVGNRLQVPN